LHGCPYQYENVRLHKKGQDVRLGAYEALLSSFLEELSEEEVKKTVNGWVEKWLSLRKENMRS
jgi:hypothetical protein